MLFEKTLLLVVAAAALGAPLTTGADVAPGAVVFVAVFAGVFKLHAWTTENVGPLVLPLKVVEGAPAPTVVTVLVYPTIRCSLAVQTLAAGPEV